MGAQNNHHSILFTSLFGKRAGRRLRWEPTWGDVSKLVPFIKELAPQNSLIELRAFLGGNSTAHFNGRRQAQGSGSAVYTIGADLYARLDAREIANALATAFFCGYNSRCQRHFKFQ